MHDSVRLRCSLFARMPCVAAGVFTLQADGSLSVNMPARPLACAVPACDAAFF
jgi:hypothetical protein